MERPPARIHRALVAFDVPDDVPHRELTAAREAAQAHARDALGAPGTVRAEGARGSARDGRRRLRFELAVSGADADETWATRAQDAFAERFLGALTGKGYDARRVA